MQTSRIQARTFPLRSSGLPRSFAAVRPARKLACVVLARGAGYNSQSVRRSSPRNNGRGSNQQYAEDDFAYNDEEDSATTKRYRRPAAGEEEEASASPSAGVDSIGGASRSGAIRTGYGAASGTRTNYGSPTSTDTGRAGSSQQRSSSTGSSPYQQRDGSSAGSAGGQYPRRSSETPEGRARAEVLRAINNARDWRDLTVILDKQGHQLDGEAVAMILEKTMLAVRPEDEAGRSEFESMLSMLYGWTAQLLPTFKPRHAVTGLVAVATLEYFNNELVSGLCASVLVGMGNLVIGSVQYSNEYYNVIWALAKMNYSPGPEWLSQFDFRTERKLGDFYHLDLLDTFSCLTKLGHAPTSGWMAAFVQASSAKRNRRFLPYSSLALVLQGLVDLRPSGYVPDKTWLDEILLSNPGLSSMHVRSLKEIVSALTQLDYQPAPQVLQQLSECFVKQRRYMNPAELASMAYSMAYLKAPLPPLFVEELVDQTVRKHAIMSGEELAYMTAALAAFGARLKERWMDDILVRVDSELASCSPAALTMLADALPLMGSGRRLQMCVDRARQLAADMQAAQTAQYGTGASDAEQNYAAEGQQQQQQQYSDGSRQEEAMTV